MAVGCGVGVGVGVRDGTGDRFGCARIAVAVCAAVGVEVMVGVAVGDGVVVKSQATTIVIRPTNAASLMCLPSLACNPLAVQLPLEISDPVMSVSCRSCCAHAHTDKNGILTGVRAKR